MSLDRTNLPELTDLAKRGIGDGGIGIAIADDIEGIEGIEAEANGLLPECLEFLECGDIYIQVPGNAYRTVAGTAEVLGAATRKAQTLLSTPGVVQGIAEGSVPNQWLMDRWTIFSLRYWLARDVP